MDVFNIKYDVFTNKKCKSKFVLIGDLHGWLDNKHIDKVVNSIKCIDPDIILIAGDILNKSNHWLEKKKIAAVKKLLYSLTESGADVVTILGNHDVYKCSDDLIHNYLSLGDIKGVYPLYNSSIDLNRNGETVHIVGLTTNFDDSITAFSDFISKIKGVDERPNRIMNILEPLLNIDCKKFNVLLAHDSRQLRIPKVDDATNRFDVRVSAHVHNGYLPFAITTRAERVLDQDWKHYLCLGIPKLAHRNFSRGVIYSNSKLYILCTQTKSYYLVVYNSKKRDNTYKKITKEEAINFIRKNNLTPNVITGGINKYSGIPFDGSEITEFCIIC